MSKRISISIPDSTCDKLKKWANQEGTSLSDLAGYLLRKEVEEAEKTGRLSANELFIKGDVVTTECLSNNQD